MSLPILEICCDLIQLDSTQDPKAFVYVVSFPLEKEIWRYTAYDPNDQSDLMSGVVEFSTREKAIIACDKRLVELGWKLIDDDKFTLMI